MKVWFLIWLILLAWHVEYKNLELIEKITQKELIEQKEKLEAEQRRLDDLLIK
jgi:hypothetical protein